MFLRENERKKLIAMIDYLGQSYNIVFCTALFFGVFPSSTLM